MSKRAIHWSGALSLVAVVALAAVGTAGAVRSSLVSTRVPAVGFRLHAGLAPVGSATGSGRFDALLSGPGPARCIWVRRCRRKRTSARELPAQHPAADGDPLSGQWWRRAAAVPGPAGAARWCALDAHLAPRCLRRH